MISPTTPIIVKSKFFFGKNSKRCARLHFRRTHNNIFVTLTDLLNKVIAPMSGGRCFSGNKRQKKAPQALEPMMAKLFPYCKQHEISSFEIWLKAPFSWHVQVLLKELSLRNLSVIGLVDKRIVAHNGVRGRKIRRI